MAIENKIFAAIDESGNYGLAPDAWGKDYLICTMVIAEERIYRSIENELAELCIKLKKTSEFKHSDSDLDTKRKFFTCIAKHNFSIALLVIDKRKPNHQIPQKKNSYLKGGCYALLVKSCKIISENIRLKIDGKASRPESIQIRTLIRQATNAKIKVSFVASENDYLVQVADMIAGATADKYKNGNLEFYNMIKGKIICEL